jgi:hypothetical protein
LGSDSSCCSKSHRAQCILRDIQEVLENPDMVKAQGAKFILAKQIKDRADNMIACVVLERKENDLWVVITVMHNFKEN